MASSIVEEAGGNLQVNRVMEDRQGKEIAELKSRFDKCCRVISNIGDFTYVVDIRKENHALNIKFQLEGSYPDTAPCIVIKNTCLDASDRTSLMKLLESKAQTLLGSQMIETLTGLAYSWCEGRECTELTASTPNKSQSKAKHKKRSKQKFEDKELKSDKKLPPMKTAEDVVSRIMWDEHIPTDSFCVGYEDRFLGIMERQFTEFSWEDIASVDYNTLAIPKHRIQYFKYKGIIVWDKSKRLDNVFGSTGSGIKITDVIAKYEEEGPVSQPVRSSDSDSDEDDDIVITVESGQNDDDIEYSRDKYWGPKKRPTHFLCLRVTDPNIVQTMEDVHQQISEFEPTYEDSLIPTRKLHLTLACLGLDDEDDIEQASDFLKDIQPHLKSMKPKEFIEVEFCGVDNFFHNVLYAKVKQSDAFMDFVKHLRECVHRAGLEIRDVFDFSPHMTILKFKKHHQAMANTRYIDSRLYDMFANTYFGKQSFDNIHLCKMTRDEEDENGFYLCPRKILF